MKEKREREDEWEKINIKDAFFLTFPSQFAAVLRAAVRTRQQHFRGRARQRHRHALQQSRDGPQVQTKYLEGKGVYWSFQSTPSPQPERKGNLNRIVKHGRNDVSISDWSPPPPKKKGKKYLEGDRGYLNFWLKYIPLLKGFEFPERLPGGGRTTSLGQWGISR